ncbi:MAG: hypothetical protein AB1585_07150 [Thermodesulfobacteriota bacterium]
MEGRGPGPEGKGFNYFLRIKKRTAWWILVIIAILFSAVYFTLFGMRSVYRHFGLYFLKPTETHWPAGSKEAIHTCIGPMQGKLVWGSSRTGSHQIFLMTLPELTIYQLTHHPHVDYHPRFSPEGSRIVFARSQRKWVSERDQLPWDIYMYDLETGREKLAASNGNFPFWLPDGQRILFLRDRQVIVKDLITDKESIIFNGRRPPRDAEPSTPELVPLNPDRLAVTLRGKPSGVFLADLSRHRLEMFSENACEITWLPGTSNLVWVEVGGRGGTQLITSPVEKVKKRMFMDLPFSFSHEYFPRFSRDGKWLVWGASEGDHEHDLADYEIFLWKLGSPWEKAVRLTYNKANDRFPDIFIERNN